MRVSFIPVVTILLQLVYHHEASKILAIFGMPSQSHTILGTALLKGLAKKGHHVTMLTPFPMDNSSLPENYTQIHWNYLQSSDAMKSYTDPTASGFTRLKMIIDVLPKFVDSIHNNTNLRNFLNSNQKFDLCIYCMGLTDSFLGICDSVNATAIGFNTVGMNVFMGHFTRNPTPFAYVPNIYLPFTDNMNFLQRVGNTIGWLSFDFLMKFINTPAQEYILKKHYPNAPPLEKLVENMDLILANTNYATDTIVPLLPNIIPIGGFHMEEETKTDISPDLQAYLNNSKRGVIYFNLGTNAKSTFISPEILQHILNSFSKLPYDILWKFEGEMPNKPENVRLEKWLPQRQVLSHPKVKLFISHGGNGGTIEAINGAIPIICMPHYGDQLKNCAGSVSNGYAIQLDLPTLTADALTHAITEIINNPKYKQAIVLKSDIYKNQAISPMEKAIFWVEHVIRHKGAKHLKARATQLPWYQMYLIDVIGFLLLFICLLISVCYVCLRLSLKLLLALMRKLFKTSKTKHE